MQMVRYAGLYARNIKHKIAPILLAALEVLRLQFPLSDIQSLLVTAEHLSWDARIKASFGYDPGDLRTKWIGPEGLKCWRGCRLQG
jgi:hypothetical protein